VVTLSRAGPAAAIWSVYPSYADNNPEIRINGHRAMALRWVGVGVDCNIDAALACEHGGYASASGSYSRTQLVYSSLDK
jgi:hypothetical protein